MSYNHQCDLSRKSIISNNSQDDGRLDNFKKIMKNNKQWAKSCVQQQPDYFLKLVNVQKPKYLWIGCSDSRVPANQIIGLKPGEVFVHRNIANIASPSDINFLAVVQYAVQYLGVQDIIVCGHYKCGGIKAAFKQNDFGPLESWLSHIREIRCRFRESLLGNQEKKQHTLVELNIKQQVINVSRVPAVQQAWVQGKNLHIHGVVYNLEDGILKDLGLTTSRIDHVPEEYRLAKKQKHKSPQNQHQNYNQNLSPNQHCCYHNSQSPNSSSNSPVIPKSAKRRISKFDEVVQSQYKAREKEELKQNIKQNFQLKVLQPKQKSKENNQPPRQFLMEISNIYEQP